MKTPLRESRPFMAGLGRVLAGAAALLMCRLPAAAQCNWTPGSPINETCGSVAIGTTTMNANEMLRIVQTGSTGINLRLQNANGGKMIQLSDGISYTNYFSIDPANSLGWIGESEGSGIVFKQGNVGVGNTGPLAKLEVGAVNSQSTPLVSARSATGNDYEFGHPNPAGYGSVIGHQVGGGQPFLAFNAEAGTTQNTYRTRGEIGHVIMPTVAFDGGVTFNTVPVASADNQSLTELMRITGAGNVGIGTSMPTTKLYVVGDVTVTGNIAADYQDVAEWVPARQRMEPGTVAIVDSERQNGVVPSVRAYDTRVAGVISEQPGMLLGKKGEGRVMVATTGRVKVKVDATKSAIAAGDLLVTSDEEGYAMRSEPVNVGGIAMHRPGTLIGKALEPLEKGKQGEILVLLSLQ